MTVYYTGMISMSHESIMINLFIALMRLDPTVASNIVHV